MKSLREIGEDALIERLLHQVPVAPGEAGPGDDCAVIDPGPERSELQLLKTDAIVCGIHFLPETPARQVGWKAAARVISDFAAMGGKPERFLVTLAISPDTAIEWLDELYAGIGNCLRQHQALLVGGETTRLPIGSAAVISVAATGSVSRSHLTLRSGARPGDSLLVTGSLGGSLHGKHLQFQPRLKESNWLVSNFKPSAMMDLSDGLAKDLPRLAAASGCGFRLDRGALPLSPGCSIAQALGDGEDYELLLAVGAEQVPALCAAWSIAFPELPLSPIGTMAEAGHWDPLEGGWDHFAPA